MPLPELEYENHLSKAKLETQVQRARLGQYYTDILIHRRNNFKNVKQGIMPQGMSGMSGMEVWKVFYFFWTGYFHRREIE